MTDEGDRKTEVSTDVLFLGKVLERVKAGSVLIPRFQRPFVWKSNQMRELLDSVRLGFPIGSIMLWETGNEVTAVEKVGPINVPRVHRRGTYSYILDGQQRLSTLFGTLYLEDQNPNHDEVDWQIYYDLEAREFTPTPRTALEPQLFPVNRLLNTTKFLAACRDIEEAVEPLKGKQLLQEADDLANAFRDYQLPVITIKQAPLDTAVTAFARLNLRGRCITIDQMVSALTYKEGAFNLADEIGQFKEELAHRGFRNLDRVLILRTVLVALDRDLYAKDWERLMVNEKTREALPDGFTKAKKSILLALDFLEPLGVVCDRLLPYGLQLVLLAEFFRHQADPTKEQCELLERWFWMTSFTAWFGSVNTARARVALVEMRELALGKRASFNLFDLDAAAAPFPTRFDARSARVRAFMLYLVSLKPRSLTDPTNELDPRELLSELGSLALTYVASRPDNPELANSPANRMFRDLELVGQAVTHLENLGDSDLLADLLLSHGFPPDATGAIHARDRMALLSGRKAALIAGERKFLLAHGITLPGEETGDAIADSDVSDDDD